MNNEHQPVEVLLRHLRQLREAAARESDNGKPTPLEQIAQTIELAAAEGLPEVHVTLERAFAQRALFLLNGCGFSVLLLEGQSAAYWSTIGIRWRGKFSILDGRS